MSERETVTIGDVMTTLTRNGVHPVNAFRNAAYVMPRWDDDGRAYVAVRQEQWYVHPESNDTPSSPVK